MKNRILRALGALTLALVMALTLWPAALAAPVQEEADFSGYLVMLSDSPQAALFSLDPMSHITLMAAEEEREELLPLAEGLGIYKAAELSDIQNLVWSGQVLSAEPDYKAELFAVPELDTDHSDPTKPNDPYFIDEDYNYQFSIKDTDAHGITARAAWDAGLTGDGVTIAVIDTGINGDHVDAPLKIARGRYYY